MIVDKGKWGVFINKLLTNKNQIMRNIVIYDVLIMIAIIVTGYILIKEKVIYGESMKVACYLILIALISCLYKNILNWKFIVGIGMIIAGIFFVESGNKLVA